MGSAAIPRLPKLYARGLPPTVLTLEMGMLLFDMLCIEKGVLVAMPVLDIGLSIFADRPPAGFAKVPGPRRTIVGAETKGAPAMERVPARYPGRATPEPSPEHIVFFSADAPPSLGFDWDPPPAAPAPATAREPTSESIVSGVRRKSARAGTVVAETPVAPEASLAASTPRCERCGADALTFLSRNCKSRFSLTGVSSVSAECAAVHGMLHAACYTACAYVWVSVARVATLRLRNRPHGSAQAHACT